MWPPISNKRNRSNGKNKEIKSICCRSISIFYLLNSCLANAENTAWKQTPVGHRERQGQWLTWLSSPAVNTSECSHCICAVWKLLLGMQSHSLQLSSVFFVFCTQIKPPMVLSLQQALLSSKKEDREWVSQRTLRIILLH